MSRRRYISTAISIDKLVNRLARDYGAFAALLYTWMIPHADDAAFLTGDPEEILLTVCPGLRSYSESDVVDALRGMTEIGLVSWDEEKVYFDSESFYRHQSYIPEAKRVDNSEHFQARKGRCRETPRNAAERRETPQNAASPSPSPSPSPSRATPPLTPPFEGNGRKEKRGDAALEDGGEQMNPDGVIVTVPEGPTEARFMPDMSASQPGGNGNGNGKSAPGPPPESGRAAVAPLTAVTISLPISLPVVRGSRVYDVAFEEWWKLYGKVGSKADAAITWLWWVKKGGATTDELAEAARRYVEHCVATGTLQKHGATFLSKKPNRWEEWLTDEHGSCGHPQRSQRAVDSTFGSTLAMLQQEQQLQIGGGTLAMLQQEQQLQIGGGNHD
jgi:hypothetical protein